jgi:YihY family inner membrane protein
VSAVSSKSPDPRPPLLRAARSIAQCCAGIVEDEASLRASSLAYSVLFCAAPIFAMLLGLSSLFPKAFSFLPRLYEEIAPRVLPSALEQVAVTLRGFADNATHLSVASLALFLVSAMFLSMQLERCIQSAWGLRVEPALAGNPLARHWLALTLTPCAMALIGWAAFEAFALAPTAQVSWGASMGILFAFFLISTWALPAARPPFLIASFASALASVECLLIQSGFGYAWSMSLSYGVIYGAAAVFLGALLWIWLFWLSLLSSVSISSTLFLGRSRDLRLQGLGLVEDFFELTDRRYGITPPPVPERVEMPPALELRLLDTLGGNPLLCDPALYAALRSESANVAVRRAAFGEACASRAAQDMIDKALVASPLANTPTEDKIATPSLSSPSHLTDIL